MDTDEAVEVQVLHEGGGKPHCLVLPSSPSFDVNESKLRAKTEPDFDDASTARTEISTEIDEMSEKLSFGSMYLSDGGTYRSNSQGDSFDAPQVAMARSKRNDLLVSVPESRKLEPQKDVNLVNSSLLDLDDDDDYSESDSKRGVKTTLENKLCHDALSDFHGESDQSNFAYAGSFVGENPTSVRHADFYRGYSRGFSAAQTPASLGHTLLESESRADFYGGLVSPASTVNTLRNSERYRAEFYGRSERTFSEGTLKTDMPVGLFRVSCSDTEGPLSCREKLEQPGIGFDEDVGKEQKKGSQQKNKLNFLSSVACCFSPTQL
mmetsp:Transcript_23960/g.50151  ORF Transcript_23960/g.50151 Transcript_23960/m.50151 type:complete len:322 (-) Transcript_23960:135-1100(-)